MGIKQVTRLNEGPLDYLMGAGRSVGRNVSAAGRNIAAAGQTASITADLAKLLSQFAQVSVAYDKLTAQQPAPAAAAQQAAPAQTPPAQQPLTLQRMDRRARKPKASKPATGAPAAFRGAGRPTVQGAHGPEFRFEQYLQAVMADELNEGAWDFIKGAGGEAVNKARQWVNNYANRPSLIRDLYQAGKNASAAGNANRQANQQAASVAQQDTQRQQLEHQRTQLIQQIKSLLSKAGPQAQSVIAAALSKLPQDVQQYVSPRVNQLVTA